MKVMVIGNTGSGKTTVGKIIARLLGTKSTDTSDILIEELASAKGVSVESIRDNKENFRKPLYDLGVALVNITRAYMSRKALEKGNVVVGVRTRIEFDQAKELFDLVVWVDGRGAPRDGIDTLTLKDAHWTIDNSGELRDTALWCGEAITYGVEIMSRMPEAYE